MHQRFNKTTYSIWAAGLLFLSTIIASPSVFSSTASREMNFKFSVDACTRLLTQKVRPVVLRALEKSVNHFYANWPRTRPETEALANCLIVAHRGAHELFIENTMAAFDACRPLKVWGIEFDVRWTKDNEPIVLHDVDAGRTFGRRDIVPAHLTLSELKTAVPDLPSLSEVVEAFGDRFHFMIELKEPLNAARQLRMREILSSLEAVRDYHLLSLHPLLFSNLEHFPPQAFIIVSEVNSGAMAQVALQNNWGGHSGHYLLINEQMQSRHQSQGQHVGLGFVDSKNNLYRAVQRGVKWVFTNRPLSLSPLLEDLK